MDELQDRNGSYCLVQKPSRDDAFDDEKIEKIKRR
jgi:hypothetical protein